MNKLTVDVVLGMFEQLGVSREIVISTLDAASKLGESGVFNAFVGLKVLAEANVEESGDEELQPVLDRLERIELRKWKRKRGRTATALMEVVGDRYECCEMHHDLFESVLDQMDAKEREEEFKSRPEHEQVCTKCGTQFKTRDPGKDRCVDCTVARVREGMPARLAALLGK